MDRVTRDIEEAKAAAGTELRAPNPAVEAKTKDLQDGAIRTKIDYTVQDPKHEHEKPYDIRYDTGGVIPRTNTAAETHDVVISDFRPRQNDQNFAQYGFCVEKIDCKLTTAVFDEEKEKIQQKYYPAIKKILWRKFPGAAGVYVLDYNLRRRYAQFPVLEESLEVDYAQPATLAHIDTSLDSAVRTVRAAFDIPPDRSRRVVAVNLWKSLQGPGNDWPLALCDCRTVDHATETIAADVVYHNRFTETLKVYHSPRHEWYYVKDLDEDEMIMFLQKDSEVDGGGGVPHTSFKNPKADVDAALRKSIEFRTFVVFA